jgi:predicted house-cleaning noncanonical NTP pyrophosphatase (MazG superfamily)
VIEGKLVRDLIPDIIRESGRPADVRYLSGAELLTALAKLIEERLKPLVQSMTATHEELADVTEVMAALMALRGIGQQEVFHAAMVKASACGRFETGAWMSSADWQSTAR